MSDFNDIMSEVHKGTSYMSQNAMQMQQLFMAKDQQKRQKEKDDFERSQANVKRALSLITSGSKTALQLGAKVLTAEAKAHPEQWGGESPDFQKIFTVNEGSDELKDIQEELKKIISLELPPQDASYLYSEVSRKIKSLPSESLTETLMGYDKEARKVQGERQAKIEEAIMNNKLRLLSPQERRQGVQGALGGDKYGRPIADPAEEKPAKVDKNVDAEGNVTYVALGKDGQELWTKTYPKKGKPMGRGAEEKPPDYDKKLTELHSAKARLQSTKGANPIDLLFIKDNPQAMAALKNNDIAPAIAEYDYQIKKYSALRSGAKLTKELAIEYLKRANGDRKAAEDQAKKDGFTL